jgi:pyruvate kinase
VRLTPNRETERQLTLSWGVERALVAPFSDRNEIFDLAGSWALEHKIVERGDRLVVTAGAPVGIPGTTNLIKMMEIEWPCRACHVWPQCDGRSSVEDWGRSAAE